MIFPTPPKRLVAAPSAKVPVVIHGVAYNRYKIAQIASI
jgi:hypothetical protein